MSHTIPTTVTVRIPTPTLTPQEVLEALPRPLQRQTETLYRTLHAVGLHALEVRGHTLPPAQVTYHQSGELLASHLGISRVTLYKHLGILRELGLVHSRGHVSALGGLARKDGTLFAVSLKAGHRARLRWDDLRHRWRDLGADIAENRTAWAFLQKLNSHTGEGRKVELQHLKAWALKPGQTQPPVKEIDCKEGLRETVYSLPMLSETHKSKRAELVDKFAHALASGFLDSSNLNFWRWLLWRGIEGEHLGLGTLYRLSNALTRLQADVIEWEGLKSPGALLVARLRQAGLWDELKST